MPSDTFIKPSVCKHPECRRQVLFPVQPLLLERLKLRVGSDAEMFAIGGAEGAEVGVGAVGAVDDGEFRRHGESWGSRDW